MKRYLKIQRRDYDPIFVEENPDKKNDHSPDFVGDDGLVVWLNEQEE